MNQKKLKVIAVANQKGGTGKTTTAAALAQAAVSRGKRVLVVDMDPQANLTLILNADARQAGSFELLSGTSANQLIQATQQSIDIIPASRNLATLLTGQGSAVRLQKALKPVLKNYDLIVVDTPPTAGELQYNALQASDGLIIPLHADIFGLQGLYQISETARLVQQSNKGLRILGFVLTCYNGRSTLSRSMRETILEKANERGIPCLAEIREAVAVRECAALQQSLFTYAPKSKPAQDYMRLYETVMEET